MTTRGCSDMAASRSLPEADEGAEASRFGALTSLERRGRSAQQQARLPADALGGSAELLEGAVLDLADALLADAEEVPDLAEAVGAVTGEPEAEVEDLALARAEVLHQEVEGLLALGVLALGRALVVGHRLGELEVAVVVEDGV